MKIKKWFGVLLMLLVMVGWSLPGCADIDLNSGRYDNGEAYVDPDDDDDVEIEIEDDEIEVDD